MSDHKTLWAAIRKYYGGEADSELTDEQFEAFGHDASGFGADLGACNACEHVQGAEPDATANPCESCGERAVVGFAEAIILGFQG